MRKAESEVAQPFFMSRL